MKTNNTNILAAIILWAFFILGVSFLSTSHADEPKPKTKTLSKEEAEKVLKIARESYEANNLFQQMVNNALNVPLDDCPRVTAALGNLGIAAERLRGIKAREAELLEQQRKAHDCETCTWSQDGRQLVTPVTP
jgi:hypothetical protein